MGRTSLARQRLIDAAIDLLWHYGYGSVSVDALCARAKVKKGSFYYFFPSKDDLVVAALDTHWARRRPAFEAIFSRPAPALVRLGDYFDYAVQRQRQLRRHAGRVLGCFHASIGTECIRQNPAIAAKAQEILTAYRGYLEGVLADAVVEGPLAGRDPGPLAQSLFSLVEGALGQARIHDDLKPVEALKASAWQILGLAPLPRSPASSSRARRALGQEIPTAKGERRRPAPKPALATAACQD
jgi:TetR/AcrR family transcriptional repressor of nem operon